MPNWEISADLSKDGILDGKEIAEFLKPSLREVLVKGESLIDPKRQENVPALDSLVRFDSRPSGGKMILGFNSHRWDILARDDNIIKARGAYINRP